MTTTANKYMYICLALIGYHLPVLTIYKLLLLIGFPATNEQQGWGLLHAIYYFYFYIAIYYYYISNFQIYYYYHYFAIYYFSITLFLYITFHDVYIKTQLLSVSQ